MSLQKTPRVKAGPASLPFDVFLNIVDILIAEAEECTIVKVWALHYNYDSPTKLGVWDALLAPDIYNPLRNTQKLEDRFKHIRLPSQINRTTRAMVHRKFIRVPFMEDQLPFPAWIRAENDFFVPCFADIADLYPLEHDEYFKQAIMLPTPEAATLIKSIQRIANPAPCFWADYNASSVAALSTLPNLKEIHMAVGRFEHPCSCRHDLKDSPMPLDYDIFPDLTVWTKTHAAGFKSLFEPLEKKGVRVYGFNRNVEKPLIEIVGTEDGVSMKLLPSDCICGKFQVQCRSKQ